MANFGRNLTTMGKFKNQYKCISFKQLEISQIWLISTPLLKWFPPKSSRKVGFWPIFAPFLTPFYAPIRGAFPAPQNSATK